MKFEDIKCVIKKLNNNWLKQLLERLVLSKLNKLKEVFVRVVKRIMDRLNSNKLNVTYINIVLNVLKIWLKINKIKSF